MECGRKAVRVKAPVHPHLMSTREGGATATFSIEFRSDFCLILFPEMLDNRFPYNYISSRMFDMISQNYSISNFPGICFAVKFM